MPRGKKELAEQIIPKQRQALTSTASRGTSQALADCPSRQRLVRHRPISCEVPLAGLSSELFE